MEGDKLTTICAVLAIDHTNLSYRACGVCESTLSDSSSSTFDPSPPCQVCHFNPPSSLSFSKRLFRILMSIATDSKVITVICFDRAARFLFGCSADEFFDFAKLHPYSGEIVNEILEGEMFCMTLSKPKNDNAQHLRVVSAVPLRTGFRPAIKALREYYGP